MLEFARSIIRIGCRQSLQGLQWALPFQTWQGLEGGWMTTGLRAGELMQEEFLRLLEGTRGANGLQGLPGSMARLSLYTAQESAGLMAASMPWTVGRLAWKQLENKLRAFTLFQYARPEAAAPTEGFGLPGLIELAHRQKAYRSVWITEGLGYKHAERAWLKGVRSGLLTGPAMRCVPTNSLIALHTGMGMFLASRLLQSLGSSSSDSEVGTVAQRFLDLCQANSKEGYLEVALEPLGLAVRNLQPWLVLAFDRHLSRMGRRLQGCFWHGVGRGIYFAPTNFLPWPDIEGRALEMACLEAPNQWGQLNAVAGLCWALTLVNIRNPEILEDFLMRHSDRLSTSAACSNGVGSALIVWCHSAPGDQRTEALTGRLAETKLERIWNRLVKEPGWKALQRCSHLLCRRQCFGELFFFQPLDELAARLEARNEPKPGPPRPGASARRGLAVGRSERF